MKKWSRFKIIMNIAAIISTFLSIILFVVNRFYNESCFKTLAITFFTIAFHLDIRLIIGNVVLQFKNRINVNNQYYKLSNFEERVYCKIKVKKWKGQVPTYEPDEFDIKKKSLEEIIVNMCNSEIIHTLNVFISYIPLVFIFWFGVPLVFLLTSFLASIYDLRFVIIQRYNRERIIKVMVKKENCI